MKAKLKKKSFIKLLNDPNIATLKSIKKIREYIFHSPQRKNLINQWLNSNCQDFTVYSHPDYQWDLVDCFLSVSELSIEHVLWYLIHHDYYQHHWQSYSYFDDWNGNGLTTMDLLAKGCLDVSFYNIVNHQTQALLEMAQSEGFITPKHIDDRQKLLQQQFDVVFSLQCVEHYDHPLTYIDELIQITKLNGLLCISVDGFNSSPEKSIGHFWEYYDKDEQKHSAVAMRELVKQYIVDNGFEWIRKACWNSNPLVFKKIK